MKIGIISDLHFEFWSRYGLYEDNIVEKCNKSKCDIILNAGDTFTGPHFDHYHKKYFSDLIKKPYFMVKGNHDYYGDVFQNDLQTHILPNGMKLVCASLWTNFRNKGDVFSEKVFRQISDYTQINFEGKSPVQCLINAFDEACEYIKNEQPDIVMTHFLPFTKSIAPIYQNDDFLNTYFCNDLDNFVDSLTKKPLYWICGHTHWPHEYEHKGIKVICNPLGYPGENKGPYKVKIIKV